MLWILVLLGVFIAFFSTKRRTISIICLRISIFITSIALIILLIYIANIDNIDVKQTGNWELLALSDTFELSTSEEDNLCYATVDTSGKYTFYIQKDNKKTQKINSDNVDVHRTDNCSPHAEQYSYYCKYRVITSILLFSKDDPTISYQLYIPTHTPVPVIETLPQ